MGQTAQQGGVFLSTDGGRTWSNVLAAAARIYASHRPSRSRHRLRDGFEASRGARRIRQDLEPHRRLQLQGRPPRRADPSDSSQIYITTFGSSVCAWAAKATRRRRRNCLAARDGIRDEELMAYVLTLLSIVLAYFSRRT